MLLMIWAKITIKTCNHNLNTQHEIFRFLLFGDLLVKSRTRRWFTSTKTGYRNALCSFVNQSRHQSSEMHLISAT